MFSEPISTLEVLLEPAKPVKAKRVPGRLIKHSLIVLWVALAVASVAGANVNTVVIVAGLVTFAKIVRG